MLETLDRYHGFVVRQGTTDKSVVDEVYRLNGYARLGCTIKPGERWLDVGGHIGTFARWAAEPPRLATVISLEPDLTNAELFLVNTRHLSKVSHMLVAAGAWRGHGVIQPNTTGNPGNHRVIQQYPAWQPAFRPVPDEPGQSVSIVSMDDIAGEVLPHGVKLDCEGDEANILMKWQPLPLLREVIGEYHFGYLGDQAGQIWTAIIRRWTSMGFTVAEWRQDADFGQFRFSR